jgi:fructoselysine 6-kinase
MTRILGLGDNTIDTYVDAGVQYPGGNAVNVAAMTARLGASTAYLGCVGDDDGGRLLRNALTAEGVDISRTRTRPGANARAFISHIAGERQFIGSGPGVRADYRWEDDDFAYIATFDHVHTSFYSDLDEALPRIAASARSLSLDASDRWTPEYLRNVLPHVRFAFISAAKLSRPEAMSVAGKCLALGPEVVVLTRGSEGALGVSAKGQVFQPALPANVVDTLGAGDGFISGFLTEMLASGSMQQAMKQGAEFAAQVCGWHGGFGHAAPWTGDAEAAAIKQANAPQP